MNCNTIQFSRHAFERLFERGIEPNAVMRLVAEGEIIANYPDDKPFPSALILGFHANQPWHIVVARNPDDAQCTIVTLYRPDPSIWNETYQFRKKQ